MGRSAVLNPHGRPISLSKGEPYEHPRITSTRITVPIIEMTIEPRHPSLEEKKANI